jgi:hypothetical protein
MNSWQWQRVEERLRLEQLRERYLRRDRKMAEQASGQLAALKPPSSRTRLIRWAKKILIVFRSKSDFKPIVKSIPYETTREPTHVNHDTTIAPTPTVATKERTSPPHLTLLGLPRELRDLVFFHVFDGNGLHYVQQQLLGFPKQDYSTYTSAFQILLTCQQFYAEAFRYAYRHSCFYWFKSHNTASLERLCGRLNPQQAMNVRHISFWSNPYVCEDFLDNMPAALHLTRITVCSNYMSGAIPSTTVHGRMLWLLRTIKNLKTLKSFHFLTGCGLAPGEVKTDCEFSVHLRQAFYKGVQVPGLVVGSFDAETLTAKITVLPDEEGGRAKAVQLKIASVYEKGYGNG